MSVTDPLSAPSDSATSVNGQRNPFAANSALSPPTTAAATTARRSLRPVNPATSRYTMQDSIVNQATVCTVLMTTSARSLPIEPSSSCRLVHRQPSRVRLDGGPSPRSLVTGGVVLAARRVTLAEEMTNGEQQGDRRDEPEENLVERQPVDVRLQLLLRR